MSNFAKVLTSNWLALQRVTIKTRRDCIGWTRQGCGFYSRSAAAEAQKQTVEQAWPEQRLPPGWHPHKGSRQVPAHHQEMDTTHPLQKAGIVTQLLGSFLLYCLENPSKLSVSEV